MATYVKNPATGMIDKAPPRKRYGLGDVASAVFTSLGLTKCGGCEDRQETLNEGTDKAAELLGVKEKTA